MSATPTPPRVTVIINNRDLLEWPRRMVEKLERMPGVAEIVILDNGSSYRPLMAWYRTIPHRVLFLENLGHTAPWTSGVLDTIGTLWAVSPHVETTLEANPTSIEAENFRGYRAAGVNRVSVGVQALNDGDLKALGRQHSPEEAIAAFRLAAKIFPRVSFDMIYARPHQTPEQWRAELARE